jgi:hypothetical protein
MTKVWKFKDSGRAYDAIQCDDDIVNGATILCADGVVGLAWAWPIAITETFGAFHTAMPDAIERVLVDAKISTEQAVNAVRVATENGRPVRVEWLEYVAQFGEQK